MRRCLKHFGVVIIKFLGNKFWPGSAQVNQNPKRKCTGVRITITKKKWDARDTYLGWIASTYPRGFQCVSGNSLRKELINNKWRKSVWSSWSRSPERTALTDPQRTLIDPQIKPDLRAPHHLITTPLRVQKLTHVCVDWSERCCCAKCCFLQIELGALSRIVSYLYRFPIQV